MCVKMYVYIKSKTITKRTNDIVYEVDIDGWAEELRISARGWRTTYLGARMKNDISRREEEERRISAQKSRTTYLGALTQPVYGQYMTKYDVLHPRAEIRRSLSARQDTSSSSLRRDTSFFILAPRSVLLPLSRRYGISLYIAHILDIHSVSTQAYMLGLLIHSWLACIVLCLYEESIPEIFACL